MDDPKEDHRLMSPMVGRCLQLQRRMRSPRRRHPGHLGSEGLLAVNCGAVKGGKGEKGVGERVEHAVVEQGEEQGEQGEVDGCERGNADGGGGGDEGVAVDGLGEGYVKVVYDSSQ